MTLDDLFYHKDEAEITHRIHIKKPETITSIKYLEWYSGNATRAIAEAEELITLLKEYQQAICARYQEIIGTNYKLHLHLERKINYNNSKSYIVTIVKRFDGNNVADEEILRETFEGKERHQALKRFEALKKEYPNIENDTDIAKKHWER